MTYATDQEKECMDHAMGLYEHLRSLGASVDDAAHSLIGCGLHTLGEDLPLDEALAALDHVREKIAEREAELRARVN
jgi:hypothetical protein